MNAGVVDKVAVAEGETRPAQFEVAVKVNSNRRPAVRRGRIDRQERVARAKTGVASELFDCFSRSKHGGSILFDSSRLA